MKKEERSPLYSFNISAENACFSDPITRVNGERFSYPVPTYDGLRGICEAIIWKPTIDWVITRVRVLKEIQMETRSMLYTDLTGSKEKYDRGYCTYLRDVSYNVEAYFRWNPAREDLAEDRNMGKYNAMVTRAIKKGGRRTVFMGKNELGCYGAVTPIANIMDGAGFYDDMQAMPLGVMLHGQTYPENNDGILSVRFWSPVMRNGIITFPTPEECPKELIRDIMPATFRKEYKKGVNTSGCDEEVD